MLAVGFEVTLNTNKYENKSLKWAVRIRRLNNTLPNIPQTSKRKEENEPFPHDFFQLPLSAASPIPMLLKQKHFSGNN